MNLRRFIPDRFTNLLILAVLIATVLPVQGQSAVAMSWVTNLAIALLFFLHGSRLSREAIIKGASHWRLHTAIFSTTFIFFPIMGVVLGPVLRPFITPELYLGVLYLCILPATVQSAIAFTSIARGNVAAAVCSASASSIIGIFLTPLLVAFLLAEYSSQIPEFNLAAIGKIVMQIFVPFVVGHLLRPWLGGWIIRNASMLRWVDQGTILLVVYAAFSQAVSEGLWQQTPLYALISVAVISCIMLAIVLAFTHYLGKWVGFSREDQITLVFGGSKKSLASGLPMAQVIFAGQAIGAIVLPLIIFHQIQLMVCAVLANRYAKQSEEVKSRSS